ncbi:MAG: glycoside hydrolase family 20 zincin-like fold domain-containing protein [Candidatus Omnitrophota bacterium]
MRYRIFFLVFFLFLSRYVYAEVQSPESIIPKPQNIQLISSGIITLDSSWKIAVDLNNEEELFTAGYLQNKILEESEQNINPEIIDISDIGTANKKIIIGDPVINPVIAAIALAEGIDINTELVKDEFNQGYSLLIKPDKILILAKSTAGTFYGVISLTWLLENEGGLIILPHTKITDWPDLKIRGFYGGGTFQWEGKEIYTGSTTGQEEWIEALTKYKYNFWHNGLSTSVSNLLNREKFLKNRHFFTGVSCSPSSVSYYDKTLYEGVWVQDLSAVFNDFDIAELESLPANLLKNPSFEADSDNNGFPDSWYQSKASAADPTYWSLDNTTFYSGNYSAKLTVPSELTGTTSSSCLITGNDSASRCYDLLPDRIYQLSAWVKKDTDNDRPQTQVTCVFYHDNNYLGRTTSVTFDGNGNQWKQYKNMFSTFNEENKMYIYSRAQSTDKLDLWVDDIEITEVNNRLINVIENDSTKIHLRDYLSGIEYEEEKDFLIERSGVLNPSDPLQGNQITIKRISNGNIPPRAKVLIDYDFLPKMQQKRVEDNSCVDPKVLTVYKDKILSPILTRVTPDFIFIGMDEIRGFNRDSRSKKLHLENYELMAQFMNNIIDIIHSYDKNIKVLIWDDMISPYHNGKNENYQVPYGGQQGKSCFALSLIQKDNVVFIPWWYGDDYWGKMLNSPALYRQLNAEFLGGTWRNLDNIKNWSYLCWRSHSLGMIEHEFYDDVNGVEQAANYSWNTIKTCDIDNPPVLELETSQQVEAGEVLEFAMQAVDIDGDTITFTCLNPPQGAEIIDEDFSDNSAIFSWETPSNINGKYVVTIEANDGKGGNIPRDVYVTLLDGSYGDINTDGKVDIIDLQLCVNVVLGVETNPEILTRADVNQDSDVNVADVQKLVNKILCMQ